MIDLSTLLAPTPPNPLQLELADRQPFPERMPDGSLEVDVEAGGLVFMPRGWWHETKAAGDCLQVNFAVQGPMWLKVVSRAVREALMRDPGMRAFTHGLFGSPAEREAALDRLAEMLPRVRERLDELVALDDPRRTAEELVRLSGFKAARDS